MRKIILIIAIMALVGCQDLENYQDNITNSVDPEQTNSELLKEELHESIILGKEYLLTTITDGGARKYYYIDEGKFEERLYTTYTATALYTLLKYYAKFNDSEILDYIPMSEFIFSMQNLDNESKAYGAFDYSYYIESGKKDQKYVVGTNSKAIFTLLELYNLTGDRKYLDSAVLSANFLLTMQNDGEIMSYRRYVDDKWYVTTQYSILYNGETLSALSRIYVVTKDDKYLNAAKKIAENFESKIKKDGCYLGDDYRKKNAISSSWVIMSLLDFYKATGERKYKELFVDCSEDLLGRQILKGNQYGRWEGSYSTSGNGWIIEVLSEVHKFCLGENKDCYAYELAVVNGIDWIKKRTCNGTNCNGSQKIIGGIYWNNNFNYIRTDSVAHALNGYIEIYDDLNGITLMAVGDIMLDRDVKESIKGNYLKPFSNVKKFFRTADVLFGNMETPISNKTGKKAKKSDVFVYFKAEPAATTGLMDAGFDILSVANNHALDYGRDVFEDTLQRLNNSEILYVGGGHNAKDAGLKKLRIKDTVFGFLGFTYPKYDRIYVSWEPSTELAGVNVAEINESKELDKKIKNAKEEVDILIVSLHGGKEYTTKPNNYQKTLAELFIDSGADLVIGHHPHVVQPLEKYNGKYIAYSLGNFVFDMDSKKTRQSVVLVVNIGDKGIKDAHYQDAMIGKDYIPYIA